ncbi:hypothetical protein GCM10010409_20410 [Mycolicibacterium diernhoferi]
MGGSVHTGAAETAAGVPVSKPPAAPAADVSPDGRESSTAVVAPVTTTTTAAAAPMIHPSRRLPDDPVDSISSGNGTTPIGDPQTLQNR